MAEPDRLAKMLRRDRGRLQLSPETKERQLVAILDEVKKQHDHDDEITVDETTTTPNLEPTSLPGRPLVGAGTTATIPRSIRAESDNNQGRMPSPSIVPMALALTIVVAGLFVMASRSVPGDEVYSLKLAQERVQSIIDSDVAARHRLDELDALVNRTAEPPVIVDAQHRVVEALLALDGGSAALDNRYAKLAVGTPDRDGVIDLDYQQLITWQSIPSEARLAMPDGSILSIAADIDGMVSVTNIGPWQVVRQDEQRWDVIDPAASGDIGLRVRVHIVGSNVVVSLAEVRELASIQGTSEASNSTEPGAAATVSDDASINVGQAEIKQGASDDDRATTPSSTTPRPTMPSGPTTNVQPTTTATNTSTTATTSIPTSTTTTSIPTTTATTTVPTTTTIATTTTVATTTTTICDDDDLDDDEDDECDD